MSRRIQSLMTAIVVPALLAGAGSIASGEVVIGSFAGGVAETGWGGFSGGFVPLGDAVNTTTDFDTDGDGGALEMEAEGFAFGQVFSFTTAGNETAFFDNSLLVFDIIFRGTPTDPAEGGFNELFQVAFNSEAIGFFNITETADGEPLAGFDVGGVTSVGFAPGTPESPVVIEDVTIDYSEYRDGLGDDAGAFLEIIFGFSGGNRPFKAIDNVRLVNPSQSLAGDANGDGAVDLADLTILGNNFGTASGAALSEGDFTGDGAVDLADLTILGNNFGASSGANVAAVPEPTTAALLSLGVVAALGRRRRLGAA